MNLKLSVSKKQKNENPMIEIVITSDAYQTLKKRALDEGVTENTELARVIKRGMYNYWLHVLKIERDRYKQVEQLYEQAKKDNIILEKLIAQNEHLYEILEGSNE